MNSMRVVMLVLGLCASFGAQARQVEAERVRIHGSNVLGDRLVPTLVRGWLQSIEYGDIRQRELGPLRTEISASRDGEKLVVEIDKRGTGSGYADLISGEAEIAMTAREPTSRELEDAWQLGDLHSPEQEWVVGLDGLVVVTAPGNPVSTLTIAQLRDVLAGRIRDWKQLGGAPGEIDLHLMKASSGTDELTAQLVMAGAKIATPAQRHGLPAAIAASVLADPRALGVLPLRAPREGLKALAIRSGPRGFGPSLLATKSEDYPLSRRLHFHTGQLITALGRGFVLYSVSPAGQALVARSQFVSLTLEPMPAPREPDMPDEYLGYVAKAQRLPMTLRFSSGLDLFESRSRQDLRRLSAFLARPENAKRRLVLVGFAEPDARNPYQALSYSQERVDYVASELLALNMRVATVRGIGGRMPLAPAGDAGSKFRNNRIEVWLR